MKKIIFASLILWVGVAAKTEKIFDPANLYALKNNQFAFDLFQKISEQTDGNIFLSPYSISSALAMTFAGSNGETENQIGKTMHFGANTPDFHFGYGNYSQAVLDHAKGNVELAIANRLWGEKTYKLQPDFVKLNKEAYNAPLAAVDFVSNPEKSRLEINDWVASNTKDRIKDLLPPGSITSDSRLVLTNAIYFKGDWLYQFKEKDTKEKKFYVNQEESKKTPFMHLQGGLDYFENGSYKMVRLPYVGEKQSMVIVLPQDANKMAEVQQEMNPRIFDNVFYNHRPVVHLELPKFKMTLDLNLNGYLQKLGMALAFSKGADFSKMTPSNDLFISDVVHKAFIEIDEKGSEAAAATAVVMSIESISEHPEPKPIEFIADHPFLFYILDNETKAILFMGKIANPVSE